MTAIDGEGDDVRRSRDMPDVSTQTGAALETHGVVLSEDRIDSSVGSGSPVRQRPIELRAAIIALVATLAGTVAGSILTGVFANAAVDRQSEAQSEQAAANFLVSQRQQAYAQILASFNELRELEQTLFLKSRFGPIAEQAAERAGLKARLEALHASTKRDIFLVLLIGTPEVATTIANLDSAQDIVYRTVMSAAINIELLGVRASDEEMRTFEESRMKVYELFSGFLNQARDDLLANGKFPSAPK